MKAEVLEERSADQQQDGERDERAPGFEAIAGQQPVQLQDQAVACCAPATRRCWLGRGVAAHLHLAVVQVAGAGLVLVVLTGLSERAIEPGELCRGERIGSVVKPRGGLGVGVRPFAPQVLFGDRFAVGVASFGRGAGPFTAGLQRE